MPGRLVNSGFYTAGMPKITGLERSHWLSAAILALLLGFLATLQVRWLDQMRDADQERARAALTSNLARVSDDFNELLAQFFVELQPMRQRSRDASLPRDLQGLLSELLERWRDSADFPTMVRAVYSLPLGSPEAEIWRFDDAGFTVLDQSDMPAALGPTLDALSLLKDPRHPRERFEPPDGSPGLNLLAADVPALIVPLAGPPDRSASGPRHGWREPWLRRVAIVYLDRRVLVDEVVPALVNRAFGQQLDFHLRLIRRDAPGESLLELGPAVKKDETGGARIDASINAGVAAEVDAEVELFGPLAIDRRGRRHRDRGPDPEGRGPGQIEGAERGQWLLQASHPAGSLARSITLAHRRNLAVSLGILALLASTLVLLARSVAKARQLARQQLDFVAGITHELMTPLAALRSAGQNLADGVVTQPKQIARYGRMIDQEGRRLGELVSQVLAFARMQSGQPNFRLEPLEVQAEVDAVLEEMQPTLDAASIVIETEIAEALPPVKADAHALRRALSNLLTNAVKYGQPKDAKPFIGLTVRAQGEEILFTIRDRGPGIDPSDRPHLFEPFFRGRGLTASNQPGSGLGLALVRHLIEGQGGRVDAVSAPGRGAAFVIRLPADTSPERS